MLLAAYGLVLFYLTLFWGSSFRTCVYIPPEDRWNGVVFQTITHFVRKGGPEFMVNIVGNLAAFMPLGFLWPLLRDGRTTAWQAALLSATVSTVIETLQYLSGYRIADVDDVLL